MPAGRRDWIPGSPPASTSMPPPRRRRAPATAYDVEEEDCNLWHRDSMASLLAAALSAEAAQKQQRQEQQQGAAMAPAPAASMLAVPLQAHVQLQKQLVEMQRLVETLTEQRDEAVQLRAAGEERYAALQDEHASLQHEHAALQKKCATLEDMTTALQDAAAEAWAMAAKAEAVARQLMRQQHAAIAAEHASNEPAVTATWTIASEGGVAMGSGEGGRSARQPSGVAAGSKAAVAARKPLPVTSGSVGSLVSSDEQCEARMLVEVDGSEHGDSVVSLTRSAAATSGEEAGVGGSKREAKRALSKGWRKLKKVFGSGPSSSSSFSAAGNAV